MLGLLNGGGILITVPLSLLRRPVNSDGDATFIVSLLPIAVGPMTGSPSPVTMGLYMLHKKIDILRVERDNMIFPVGINTTARTFGITPAQRAAKKVRAR